LSIGSRSARRAWAGAATAGILAAGLLGATVLRPWVNLSADRGDDEAQLGYEALSRGDNAAARDWLREAVWERPDDAENWWNLGVAFWRLNDIDGSIEATDRSVRLTPDDSADRDQFVSDLDYATQQALAEGDSAKARRWAERAIELNSGDLVARGALAGMATQPAK